MERYHPSSSPPLGSRSSPGESKANLSTPEHPTIEFAPIEFSDPSANPTLELLSHHTLELAPASPPPKRLLVQSPPDEIPPLVAQAVSLEPNSYHPSHPFKPKNPTLDNDMYNPRNGATAFKLGLIGLLLALVLVMIGIGYGQFLLGPTGRSAEVRIPSGARASQVGQILQESGLVRSGQLFALYLRFAGLDTQVRSGLYRLEGTGVFQVAKTLTDKNLLPITTQVIFPEGWRADQMASRLSQAGFDGVEFQRLVRQPPPELKPTEATGPSLEGFLFPATYDIPRDATPADIMKLMTGRMAQEFKPDYQSTLAKLKLSTQDWVTLASIVQAEAANAGEMPVIAGIFLNRLELGQGLQSDPTVAYALSKDLPQLDRGAGDFEVDSPYNTYKYAGLPPGAIGNPGSAALQSILRPQRTNAKGQKLYYFLHAQGKIFVNVDFQGHLRDTARYR